MKSIVLLRHGESVWNKENRFTGWTDVDLTEKGVAEAYRAGNLLKEKGYVFNKAYTSYLKRAVKTLNCIFDDSPQAVSVSGDKDLVGGPERREDNLFPIRENPLNRIFQGFRTGQLFIRHVFVADIEARVTRVAFR